MNVWKEYSKIEINDMLGADFDDEDFRETFLIEDFEEMEDEEEEKEREGCPRCDNGCNWCLMTDY